MGFSAEDADKYLTKAFGWKKGYWGSEKKQPEVPTTEQVGVLTCCHQVCTSSKGNDKH